MKIISNKKKSKFLFFFKKSIIPISITFFFTAILFSFLPGFFYQFIILRQKDLNNISKAPPTRNDISRYLRESFNAIKPEFEIEKIDLVINMKNLIQLECSRLSRTRLPNSEFSKNCNQNIQAKGNLIYKNDIYPVKIRAKGDRAIHHDSFEEMSLKIDIRGEKRFFGFEEFSIQDPIIRNYTHEAISSDFMRLNNILAPNHKYMKLYINGKYKGIKHIEQGVSSELVESQRKRNGPIAVTSGRFGENTLFKIQNSKNISSEHVNNLLVILNESLKNPEVVKEIFDMKAWSKYFAIIDFLQIYHGSVSKSVKFYLNPISGLIEPLFFDGHFDTRINNFIFTDLINSDKASNCGWICDFDLKFFELFFGKTSNPNNEFIRNYLFHLDNLTSQSNLTKLREIINKYSVIRGKLYLSYARDDSTFHRSIFPHIFKYDNLFQRINKLSTLLTSSKNIKPLFYKGDDFFVISNKLNRLPQIIYLSCKNNDYKPFIVPKDNPLKIYFADLDSCKFNDINFSLFNRVNYEKLSTNIYAQYDNKLENKFFNMPRIIKPNKENKIEKLNFINQTIDVDENIIFKNKLIHLNGDVIFKIPENKTLIFENVKITSDPNSKLQFIGNKKGGSVIYKNSKLDLEKLYIAGLSSPKIILKSLYGGVNFIDSSLNINEMEVENSLDEDGVNFMYSEININKIKFNNIKSDALDSDFSKLKINQIICNYIGNDCFDVSYTNGEIKKFFSSEVLDKALSIGENSTIKVNEIHILDSELGIVAKDSSKLIVNNLKIESTKIPISLFIKKTEFENPYLEVKNPISKKIIKNSLISYDSFFKVEKEIIPGNMNSKDIKNLFYGNIYGVKTKR